HAVLTSRTRATRFGASLRTASITSRLILFLLPSGVPGLRVARGDGAVGVGSSSGESDVISVGHLLTPYNIYYFPGLSRVCFGDDSASTGSVKNFIAVLSLTDFSRAAQGCATTTGFQEICRPPICGVA